MSQQKPSGLRQPGRLPRPSSGLQQPSSKMRLPSSTSSIASSTAPASKPPPTSGLRPVGQSSRTIPARSTSSGLAAPSGSSPKSSSRPSSRQTSPAPIVQPVVTDHGFSIGDHVIVSGSKYGIIRFLGATKFAKGEWAGVELNVPEGKNDGSIGGVRYFTCKPLHGVFAKPQKLERPSSSSSLSRVSDLPQTELKSTSMSRATVSSVASEASSTSIDSSLVVGDKVLVGGVKSGTLRYKGTTDFAQGIWAGVQLDEALGKNDGAVAGKRYFQCLPKYGLFAPVHKVQKVASVATSSTVTTETRASVSQTEAPAAPVDIVSKSSAMRTERTVDATTNITEKSVISRSESSHGLQQAQGEEAIAVKTEKSSVLDSDNLLVDLRSQLKHAEEQRDLLQHQLELEKRNSEDLQFRLEEENVTRVEHEEATPTMSFLDSEVSEIKRQAEQLKCELEHSEAQQQLSAKTIRKLEIDLQQAISAKTRSEQELVKARSEIASQSTVIANFEAELQDTSLQSEVTRLEDLLQEERQKQRNALEAKDLELAELKVSVEAINQEMEKQTSTAKKMTDEVSKLQDQLEETSSQHRASTDEVGKLQHQLEETRSQLDASTDEVSKLQHQLEETGSQLKASTDEVSKRQHQLDETRSQLEALTGSVAADQQQMNQLSGDLVAKDVCITSQLQRIDELTKEVASCQEQLKHQSSLAVGSSEELTVAKEEIVEIRGRMDAEKLKSAELQKALGVLSQEKNGATDRCSSLEVELKESQSKLAFETEKTCNLQESVESLTKTLADVQLELQLSQEKNERYTEDKTNLEMRISELLKSSGNSSEQVALLDSELKERDRELDELKNIMAECEGKLNTVEKELASVKDQHSTAQASVADLTKQISIEIRSKEELASQLKAAQEETVSERHRLKEVQSELESTKSAGLTTANELASANHRITLLTESESKLTSKLQDLEHSVRDQEMAVSSARMETESKAATERELRTELQEKCDELVKRDAEMQLARTQLKDFECSLQSVKDSRTELERQVLELQTHLKEQEDSVTVERSRNAELHKRHRQLEIEKNEILEQYNLNSTSLKDVETRLSAQSEEVEKLNAEITSYNKQIEDLRVHLKSSEDSVEFLTSDKSRLEQEMNELLRTSDDSSNRMMYLEEQVKDKNQELEKLLVSSRETQNKLESVEKQLVTAKLEITAEQERSRTLESDLNLKSSLSDVAKGEAESAQRQIQTLTEQQSHLEENLRKVQALLDEEQEAKLSLAVEKDASCRVTQELEQKLDEKSRQLQATDKELQSSAKKLDEVTQELEDAQKVTAELMQQQAEELRKSLQEKQEVVEKCDKLVLERDAVAGDLDKAINDSRASRDTISTLTAAKESLSGDLKLKEEECDILTEQIGELTQQLQQSTQLADERLEAITVLKSQETNYENRISLLSDALANAENEATKSSKMMSLDMNNMDGADEVLVARVKEIEVQMAEVQIENESLHNQVEFLNTVIVDLQHKNNRAEKRLAAMDQGIELDESDLQLMEDVGDDFSISAPPERLFCDICDVFDEHDTEDCPQQAMEDDIGSSHHGQRGEERPYCDNCEEFGHWTEECDDNETF